VGRPGLDPGTSGLKEGVRPAARATSRQRSQHDVTEQQGRDSLPVQVRSEETPRSSVVQPPALVERPASKRGESNSQSATLSEVCSVVIYPCESRASGCRACSLRAKAMEDIWVLGADIEEPSGARNVECEESCRGNWRGPPRPSSCGDEEFVYL
jgi:hypothetical protein